jgi:Asp-tRNA(Asn)/Glu-tRNA(Gln) amidotransferase A subunit family amidase
MKSMIETAAAIRSGAMSAVEAVTLSLERIAARDGAINAFVYLDAEGALAAARAVDAKRSRGEDIGPLGGVPFGAKDNEAVIGMPTRRGSLLCKDAAPETEDCIPIARLRQAGAIPLGKVAMSEYGLDGVTHTIAHGTTRNPWNLERTPAGSSGGSSAAVSAALVPFCTGSDGLGSIRCPAGFTGLAGLKASKGRIPHLSGFADTATFGALTTTVADTARYLDVCAGPDDGDRTTLPAAGISYEDAIEMLDVRGLRVAYSKDLGYAPVTDDMARVCRAAFDKLCDAVGLVCVDDAFACTNAYVEWNALAALKMKGEFERLGFLPDHIDLVSPGPRAFIENAQMLSPAQQIEYEMVQKQLEREIAALFRKVDVLITPTACCEAYAAEGPLPVIIEGRDASRTNAEPYTTIGSICWNPSISVPAGLSKNGLPMGLLINTRRHRDDVALRLARIWEQTQPWPRHAPGY